MANPQAVKYWLESLNLVQYYDNFYDNNILGRKSFECLDDNQLVFIGIDSASHRQRILSHLPKDNIWMDENSATSPPPSLPQKTKSIRDSFLYTDNAATRLNDNAAASSEKPTPTPRPVPRPRTTVANANRPKPKPRTRPKTDQSQLNIPDSPTNSSTSITVENNGESDINTNSQKLSIAGVCSDESTTDVSKLGIDISINKELKINNLKKETKKESITKEHDYKRLESGEYINIDCNNEIIAENQPIDQPSVEAILGNRDTTFENVEFDANLNVFKVKEELAPEFAPSLEQGTVGFSDSDQKSDFTQMDSVPSNSLDEQKSWEKLEDEEDPGLYEAIWVDPRKNIDNDKPAIRNSSLMQFSPERQKSSSNPRQSVRISQLIGGNRTSSLSFDMPPPSFPPPPLPGDQIDDLINDFDPLTVIQPPPLPARPAAGPPAKPFEIYENVRVRNYHDSVTLPSDQNMEPDILSPDILGFHQMKDPNDPFQHVDPFAEVHLDVYEDVGMTKPSSCGNENSESSTFGTFTSFSPKTKKGPIDDTFYDMAADDTNNTDFDPFGLKTEEIPRLPRSVSSNSSGSGHRLDVVPPAPVWFDQLQERSSLYSVAREDGDSDSNGSLDDLLDRNTDDTLDSGNMSPVEVNLPTTALSPRRRERSGYLFKQGGVRNNRGWRRRWVIFDGKSLRYYSSSKDQVSKRIVPLSCMLNVEMDVKCNHKFFSWGHKKAGLCGNALHKVQKTCPNSKDLQTKIQSLFNLKNNHLPSNSKQFKFKLHCTNRVFLFATDNLDDCKMWSSTLMEAILTYKKPEGGEIPGGDMANPDMADWIKLDKNRLKFYVVLKKHKFCYYQNKEDFNMASPLHEIDMKLASVKEIERTKLQLSTHYCIFILHFESSSDASNWKMSIEEAITDALGDNSVLDQVKENPDNVRCADCGSPDANWASMNLGIVLCLKCAGIHRGFDHRLSKVRSLRMDTKVWNSSLIEMFKVIGNANANKFWLANLPSGTTLNPSDSPEKRKTFIHKKYKEKHYCDRKYLSMKQQDLNEALLQSAQTDNVLLTMQILLSGADVLYARPNDPNSTAYDLAKEAHQRIQMEFLLQNGGDKSKNFMPGSEEAGRKHCGYRRNCLLHIESLVASLRAAIQFQGVLQKTGSNMKDFLKRWCVLEHGHLSYFVNEESKVEKDRIDNDDIMCIQSTSNDKQHPYCFEISSRKNTRTYLFSASTEKEQQQWLTKISQVFCPVHLIESMKTKTVTLAGYAYLKTGLNSNWQRSWYVLENRQLLFTDKEQEERVEESIDLRKVKSITKVTESISACEACLEQGPLIALSGSDRTLYFQSDLVKDTDRMFNAFEIAVKRGGDILEDQVLHSDDCPVFVQTCVNYIELHGLKMRGIYREAAQDSRVQALMDQFKEDARFVVLRLEDNTVHEVCNALKRYLRRLKDPLLTSCLYKRWIQTATDCDHNSKLQWYKYLLQQLPRINYRALKCLAAHLKKLSKHSDENLMTLDNISIAFGSTLMQAENMDGGIPNAGMVGTQMQLEMKVITDIVMYCEWLFDIEQSDESKDLEDKLKKAEQLIQQINNRGSVTHNDLMIWVYYKDPKGSSESVKVNKETKVSDVLATLISKMKLGYPQWALHEVVKGEIERPLHPDEKLWPLIHEWRNWSEDYSAKVCLCLKTNELTDKLKQNYDRGRALFAEMRYADKKKFIKTAFEFTQAKLSYYKDLKNLGNPVCSWNIEDLCIYKGHDSKRSPPSGCNHPQDHFLICLEKRDKEVMGKPIPIEVLPFDTPQETRFGDIMDNEDIVTRWQLTFLSKGDKVGSKELPFFGRTFCCASEQEQLLWMAVMLNSQNSWFT